MDTLTRALREAADDAPTTLGGSVDAGSTWRRGRRRLALARAGNGVALLAVLVVVVGLVLGPLGVARVAEPAGPTRDGVTSHPQRIGHQWWVRDLPGRGTPVAAVVRSREAGSGGWQAVGASGTRYRMPQGTAFDVWPSVADDGTRIGFLGTGDRALYRVLDLGTGRHTDYPDIGVPERSPDGTRVGGRPYGLDHQSPGTFSPDGERLALTGFTPTDARRVLVLEPGGAVREVDAMDQPAGWLDDDRLLGRTVTDDDVIAGQDSVDLVIWDRRTGRTSPLGTVTLHVPGRGATTVLFGQWWGHVRGDGTLWLRGSDDRDEGGGSVSSSPWTEGFALPSLSPVDLAGRRVPAPSPVPIGDGVPHAAAWAGADPLGPSPEDPSGSEVTVAAGPASGSRALVTDVDLDLSTLVWARDALDGGPTSTPFGTSTSWIAWWWREVGLAAVGVLGAWRLRRRRVAE